MITANDKNDNSDLEPAYESDEGPLGEEFMKFLRKKAAETGPKGKLISEVSLFDIDFDFD